MRSRRRNRQRLLAGIVLGGFAVRALIPAGFMPASDRPWSLEICWDGFPAALLTHSGPAHAAPVDTEAAGMDAMPAHSHHHHHAGGPPHSEHCVFGSACSAGPLSQPFLSSDGGIAHRLAVGEFASLATAVRLVHLPQPRAPPGQLS